jgi:hypothetical protein
MMLEALLLKGGGLVTRARYPIERGRIRAPLGMAGMPIMVVARNLGHASTKMVEQHYGHLRPDFVAEQVQQHAPTFGFEVDHKVAALRGRL